MIQTANRYFLLAGLLIPALLALNFLTPVSPAAPQSKSRLLADAKPWADILGPGKGVIPPPRAKVEWMEDVKKAMALAKAEDRPLFVTFRCLPCKQCSDFDKQVLEGGVELDPLLRQFITVRITSASNLDLRLFPVNAWQDLDLSWWGYFLSPDGRIYGVYGGRDHVSDKTRISVPSLAATLKRVLDHHHDLRRKDWDIDGPAPDLSTPAEQSANTPETLPGFKSWKATQKEVTKESCLHCHQLMDVIRQPTLDAKQFDKRRDVLVWPLPENLGITLDRDHGLKITAIEPASAAAIAGLKVGDVLAAADGRKLFSQTDFRAVLHRGPGGNGQVIGGTPSGPIAIHWMRDGQLQSGKLIPHSNWRKTVLDWRMSISQGNIGGRPGFWPLAASAGDRQKFKIKPNDMAVKPYWGKPAGPAHEAGLKSSDVIIAVDGFKPNLVGRAFLTWFLLDREPGQKVNLTVMGADGQKRQISYRSSD